MEYTPFCSDPSYKTEQGSMPNGWPVCRYANFWNLDKQTYSDKENIEPGCPKDNLIFFFLKSQAGRVQQHLACIKNMKAKIY